MSLRVSQKPTNGRCAKAVGGLKQLREAGDNTIANRIGATWQEEEMGKIRNINSDFGATGKEKQGVWRD